MWSSSIGLRRTKCARCDTRRWCPTNRPSSEDRFRRCRSGVRARPRRGITVAGQRRDLTGFAGPPPLRLVDRSARTLALRRDPRHRPKPRGDAGRVGQSGATSSKPMAASSAAADRITTRSACCGPTSWMPTGSPPEVSPGTHRRGGRARHVEGIREARPVGFDLAVDEPLSFEAPGRRWTRRTSGSTAVGRRGRAPPAGGSGGGTRRGPARCRGRTGARRPSPPARPAAGRPRSHTSVSRYGANVRQL